MKMAGAEEAGVVSVQMPAGDQSWSSQGLAPAEALRHWQHWVHSTLAPTDIAAPDTTAFFAQWQSYALGPLQMVAFEASPQHVVHEGNGGARCAEATFQLVYSRRECFATRVGPARFPVNPGEFVLLDNAQPYEMRMDSAHEAIDLIMPASWLLRYIPDPLPLVGRSFSASSGWGLPLGSLLTTMSRELSGAAVPRAQLADQVGSLLSFATGYQPATVSRHRGKIIQRLLHLIEERHSEPELNPGDVATALGISKRYVHALLAESGTTFVCLLNRIRLERASEMLADPRFASLQVAEIAWRCGYLDSSYFARLFRRRFDMRPSDWRLRRSS
jgi:AraC-like DNA-binding protein